MRPSYYRLKEDLRSLILTSTKERQNQDGTLAKMNELDALQLRIAHEGFDDLYDAGVEFRHWLDDFDIRERDAEYATAVTKRLEEWCSKMA